MQQEEFNGTTDEVKTKFPLQLKSVYLSFVLKLALITFAELIRTAKRIEWPLDYV